MYLMELNFVYHEVVTHSLRCEESHMMTFSFLVRLCLVGENFPSIPTLVELYCRCEFTQRGANYICHLALMMLLMFLFWILCIASDEAP